MSSITVEMPADVLAQAEKAAKAAGLSGADAFVRWAVEDKLRQLDQEFVYGVVERIKQGLAERGGTAEEVLEDFERFRRSSDHR